MNALQDWVARNLAPETGALLVAGLFCLLPAVALVTAMIHVAGNGF